VQPSFEVAPIISLMKSSGDESPHASEKRPMGEKMEKSAHVF
jgi:hypothetical protein